MKRDPARSSSKENLSRLSSPRSEFPRGDFNRRLSASESSSSDYVVALGSAAAGKGSEEESVVDRAP